MSSLLAQVTVILILGVIIFVITRVCGGLGKSMGSIEGGDDFQAVKDKLMETNIMGFWKIEVLNQKGKVIRRKEIPDIEDRGFYIGRGKTCDLRIKSPFVSEKHAVIASDEKGFFIKDYGSKNGVYYKNKKMYQMDLEDKMLIYFGNIPCRISKTNSMEGFLDRNEERTRMWGGECRQEVGDTRVKRDER